MEVSARHRVKGKNSVKDQGFKTKNTQKARSVKETLHIQKFLWRIVLTVATVVVIGLIAVYLVAVVLMYTSPTLREMGIYLHPLKNPFHNLSNPGQFGLVNTRNFYLNGSMGKLGAWHIPPSRSSIPAELGDGNPIVLYLHGNALTRAGSHRIMLYKLLASLDYHVIAFDYRGFGDSEGWPSEKGLIDDAVTAWNWVKAKAGDAQIFIWGHSLGTGVASGVGKELCEQGILPAGIILEAPFNNVQDGAQEHRITVPFRFLPYFKEVVIDELQNVFRSDKRIAKITCSILILHDKDDELVPVSLGRKLFEAAQKTRPKQAAPVKFIEFNEHLGHKYICNSKKLPEILRNFIGK